MLLDVAETVLGIFGFDRTLYGKSKDKRWWMELKGQNERCTSRDWYEMIESQVSHPTCELVACHKVERRFMKLKKLETEDPDELVRCEFGGQDFELVAD